MFLYLVVVSSCLTPDHKPDQEITIEDVSKFLNATEEPSWTSSLSNNISLTYDLWHRGRVLFQERQSVIVKKMAQPDCLGGGGSYGHVFHCCVGKWHSPLVRWTPADGVFRESEYIVSGRVSFVHFSLFGLLLTKKRTECRCRLATFQYIGHGSIVMLQIMLYFNM